MSKPKALTAFIFARGGSMRRLEIVKFFGQDVVNSTISACIKKELVSAGADGRQLTLTEKGLATATDAIDNGFIPLTLKALDLVKSAGYFEFIDLAPLGIGTAKAKQKIIDMHRVNEVKRVRRGLYMVTSKGVARYRRQAPFYSDVEAVLKAEGLVNEVTLKNVSSTSKPAVESKPAPAAAPEQAPFPTPRAAFPTPGEVKSAIRARYAEQLETIKREITAGLTGAESFMSVEVDLSLIPSAAVSDDVRSMLNRSGWSVVQWTHAESRSRLILTPSK